MNKKYCGIKLSISEFTKQNTIETINNIVKGSDTIVGTMIHDLPSHVIDELKREGVPVPNNNDVPFCSFSETYKSVWCFAIYAGNEKILLVMPTKIAKQYMEIYTCHK